MVDEGKIHMGIPMWQRGLRKVRILLVKIITRREGEGRQKEELGPLGSEELSTTKSYPSDCYFPFLFL